MKQAHGGHPCSSCTFRQQRPYQDHHFEGSLFSAVSVVVVVASVLVFVVGFRRHDLSAAAFGVFLPSPFVFVCF